jgi:hypothetical protein
MKKPRSVQKPRKGRIQDEIREFLDKVAAALDGMFRPEPVPVPVRSRRR